MLRFNNEPQAVALSVADADLAHVEISPSSSTE